MRGIGFLVLVLAACGGLREPIGASGTGTADTGEPASCDASSPYEGQVGCGPGQACFFDEVSLAFGVNLASVAAGDLDGDGWASIAGAAGQGVVLFEPNCAGAYAFSGSMVFEGNVSALRFWPSAAAPHDDLLVLTEAPASILRFAGGPDGLAESHEEELALPMDAHGLEILRHDGAPTELFVLHREDDVVASYMWSGEGAIRTFEARNPSFQELVDLDEDGEPDLLVLEAADLRSGEPARLSVWWGRDPEAVTRVDLLSQEYPGTARPGTPAAFDVDGDGDLDLLVPRASVQLTDDVYMGTGGVEVVRQVGARTFEYELQQDPFGAGPSAFAVANVDGVGAPELLAAYSHVAIYPDVEPETVDPRWEVTGVGGEPMSVEVHFRPRLIDGFDLNGDGLDDVMAYADLRVYVYIAR